ncbi:MAG: pyridoxal phosphate-dependent aminotransferase [Rhodovibrionaceae bacterium]
MQLAAAMSRLGTESAFEVLARAKALEAEGRSIVNLGIGQPDFPTPPHVVEAAVKALKDGHHGYTPANGIPELRRAVSDDLAWRLAVKVEPDRVVVVPGGKVTMFFAILMFGEPGAEILYPDPGFPIYRSVIEFTGAKAVPVPLREENAFGFSAEEVLSKIGPATRLLIVNTPANPTGGITPRAEMDKLAEGLLRHPELAILSDEIYGQMLYDGAEHASLLHYPELKDRLILLDGWSKTYAMTGWRLGYGVWPEALAEQATRLAINSNSCVNAPTQWAGIAALTGPQDAVAEMTAAFDRRRALLMELIAEIPQLSCVRPAGAFYAFPNISKTGLQAKLLETELLEQAGVATIAGTSFGRYGEGYLRLSYATSEDNLREALRRIGAHLAERS